MRTLGILALIASVVSCHLDKLLNAGGGAPPTSHGTPVQLVFAPVPKSASAGRPIPPVRVSVADSAGQPVAGVDSAMVTVVLASNPGGATLSGNTSAHPVRGVATFTDLRLDKPAPGYALKAATDGLQPVTSDTFTVAPGPATRLRFAVQPSNVTQNAAISPPVQVTAFDSLDNQATNFTGEIRVALAKDGSVGKNARLSGASANAVAGVATFSNLRIDQTGVGYTLSAAFAGATPVGESDSFNVIPVPPPPPPPGNLTISTSTTGANLDPDGYAVALDGGTSSPIGINTNITVSSVAAGDHSLSLSGVASNCAVTGANPRTVTVPPGGTAQTSFAITCAAPPPGGATHLVFTDDPQTVQVGQVMPPVRATVYDASEHEVANFSGTVTIEIDSNPGNGTLSTARKTIIMNNPVAQWTDLSIDRPGNGYVLRATSPGLATGVSDPFDVTVGPAPSPAGATGLAYYVEPTTTRAGAVIPSIRVGVQTGGSLNTSFTGALWITLSSNPSGAVLSGTRRVQVVNGYADFTDLRIDKPGRGYVLHATHWPLNEKYSLPFDITP
jgi:hypothetical protein